MVMFFVISSTVGTVIATVIATDPDGDSFVFTITDTGGGPFSIGAISGAITVTPLGSLNYEAQSSYTVAVTVQETTVARGVPLNTTILVTVAVVDVNEPPYFSVLPNGYTLDEESVYPMVATPYTTNGVMVVSSDPLVAVPFNGAFVSVNDEDFGNNSALVVTATSSGVNTSYLEVVNAVTGGPCRGGQNCTLRVQRGSSRVNYDAPAAMRWIAVVVMVQDSTGLSASSSPFNVTINDINQGAVGWCGNRNCLVFCWDMHICAGGGRVTLVSYRASKGDGGDGATVVCVVLHAR